MKGALFIATSTLLLAATFALTGSVQGKIGLVKEAQALKNGVEAYLFGYPLVLMDVTKQVGSQPNAPGPHGPINQFIHIWSFPDPNLTIIVSPNADTLYSTAIVDLSREPLILHVPDTGGRYYLMQIMDAWSNVIAAPGKRTTGTKAGDFAIAGPGWQGNLPPGVKKIQSPTNLVWIIGRTQCNGKADYAAVNAIQRQYSLTPLSFLGKPYTPPGFGPVDPSVDVNTPPVTQVAKMDAATFFNRLALLLQDNPPAPADAPMVRKLAGLGIVPGQPFDPAAVDPAVMQGLEKAVWWVKAFFDAAAKGTQGPIEESVVTREALEILNNAIRRVLTNVKNGWMLPPMKLGRYGTDYALRAYMALYGFGANWPEDAVYPSAQLDARGQQLNGAHRYVLHLAPGGPPVNAFWSLSMYNSKQAFVPNPLDRYAIGDRDKLKFNPDGSLDLYLQHESPGKDKEANWLPAPKDDFNVILRLYWPQKAVLDGSWVPLGVQRAP
ncbi:MAG: DUF1254 domain-containing protein [Thermodesulfobacteriota bacterium]